MMITNQLSSIQFSAICMAAMQLLVTRDKYDPFIVRKRMFISSHLTSIHLNWVRCDWSQPRRTGSGAAKRPSSPWLRPITVHSVQTKRGQLTETRLSRSYEMRWGEMSNMNAPWGQTNDGHCDQHYMISTTVIKVDCRSLARLPRFIVITATY